MFTRAIVRPPEPNFSEGLTTAGLGAPDYKKALRQHEAYCAALEQCGLALRRLDPDAEHPDSTFVEDTALVFGALSNGQATAPASAYRAVVTRPGAVSRRGEVIGIESALEECFPASAIKTIDAPGTLDGGDVCEADKHFFIGVSERTNESGAQQLAQTLARCGYTSSLVDIRPNRTMKSVTGANRGPRAGSPREVVGATGSLLHLKSGIAYLGDNRLAITEELASRQEFSGYDLISVQAGEEYAANCVRINDHVLVAAGFPVFESTIRTLGYQAIVLEMSEFQKMDGGLSCLSLRF